MQYVGAISTTFVAEMLKRRVLTTLPRKSIKCDIYLGTNRVESGKYGKEKTGIRKPNIRNYLLMLQ